MLLIIITTVLLTTGRSYGAKIMMVLISTNISLLQSLSYKSPVRDRLFIEIKHLQENEPHPVDLYVNACKINMLAYTL
jgi:hypothetical protein